MNHQANTGGPQRACVADATVSLPAGKQLSIDIRWAGSRITNPDHLPKHPKSCLFQREIPISLLFLHNFTQKIPIFFVFHHESYIVMVFHPKNLSSCSCHSRALPSSHFAGILRSSSPTSAGSSQACSKHRYGGSYQKRSAMS